MKGSLGLVFAVTALVSLATAVACTPSSPAQPDPGTPDWLARHIFDGHVGCLAIRPNQSLKPGDEVLVFAPDAEVAVGKIAHVIDGDSLKPIFAQRGFDGVYADTTLWARIGCYWALGILDDPPALAVARYEPYRPEYPSVLAITDLPQTALTIGADGRTLGTRELVELQQRCTSYLPNGFSSSKLLLAGRRYESVPGHELVELFIGRPFGGLQEPDAVIDSVQIFRFFLDNGTVLCSEEFSRVSGEEERAETEAPQLSSTNWFENWDVTLGFVSFDTGATWARLSVDEGFEGLYWAITKLARGMPDLWSFGLYTRH